MQKLVRDLYANFDSGNPKNALRLVTAGLQQFPGDNLLQAFEAIALDRCNRLSEARAQAAAIIENCTEEDALRMCVITLERAGEFAIIFEALLKKFEILFHKKK